MKILLVADYEERSLWGEWTDKMAQELSAVDLILSAGDLAAPYLEFLVNKLNIPVVYVPGNHDNSYIKNPPRRCIDADNKIIDLRIGEQMLRIAGFGGSMRYKEGPYLFTEEQQAKRVGTIVNKIKTMESDDNAIKIMLTHAPCEGYGDMSDLAHRGFSCFNEMLQIWRPKMHVYGHVHEEYNFFKKNSSQDGKFQRLMGHPSGAQLINGCGYCFIII